MSDAHRRVGLVDVLAAGTRGTVGIDADILIEDFNLDILGFRQNRHGGCRGMDATTGFGGRHALYAVNAGFELQLAENTLAGHRGDDFLVAAHLTFGHRVDLDLPALPRGITAIHTEQVAGENGRFVTAGAGTDFENGGGIDVLILRRQQQGHAMLQFGQGGLQLFQFLSGQRRQVRIVQRRHLFQFGHRLARLLETADRVENRLQFGMFLRQLDDFRAVGR